MPYCHECGKQTKEEASFCSDCGTKLKEAIKVTERKIQNLTKTKSHKGLVVFFIFIIIIGYVILDIWAATQIEPDYSLDSFLTTVSNFQGNTGYTSASASTTLRMKNPTFVPIILFPVTYDFSYGNTQIAEGTTGMVFIAPGSSNDIPADIKISYLNTGISVVKGIWNSITGRQERLSMNFYELGFNFLSVG